MTRCDYDSCALLFQERLAFYNKWRSAQSFCERSATVPTRLDQKCRELVEEQAPYVQRELISNFNPPAGTKNVAGRMTAFLNMILNKTRHGFAPLFAPFLSLYIYILISICKL